MKTNTKFQSLLILFVLFIGLKTSKAQSSSQHELGAVVLNKHFRSGMPTLYDFSENLNPFSGIFYKNHRANHSLRALITYRSCSDLSFINDDALLSKKKWFTTAQVGFEKQLTTGKFATFYGVDAGIIRFKSLRKKIDEESNEVIYAVRGSHTGFIATPFFGVKYQISPLISVSSELRYDAKAYFASDFRYTVNKHNAPEMSSPGLVGDLRFHLLSVHFHLR